MRPLARRVVKLESLKRADGDVFHLTWRLPGDPEPEREQDHHCFVWKGKGTPPSPRWTTTAKLPSEEAAFVRAQLIEKIRPMLPSGPPTPEEREMAGNVTNAELLNVMLRHF